jgi:hypothetical protein
MQTVNSHGNCFYMQLKSICALLVVESPDSDHLDLKTDIRAKLVTYAIFGFLGPYKHYPCHNSMVSLNNQGIIRKHTVKIQILVVPIVLHVFFLLISKVQLFEVPFRGTWLRRENLKMQTVNSHGNCF